MDPRYAPHLASAKLNDNDNKADIYNGRSVTAVG